MQRDQRIKRIHEEQRFYEKKKAHMYLKKNSMEILDLKIVTEIKQNKKIIGKLSTRPLRDQSNQLRTKNVFCAGPTRDDLMNRVLAVRAERSGEV